MALTDESGSGIPATMLVSPTGGINNGGSGFEASGNNDWAGIETDYENGVHSLKIDIQDGYVNAYGFGTTKNGKRVCSTEAIQDASADFYKKVYDSVMTIVANEGKIPSKVRRNILVPLAR